MVAEKTGWTKNEILHEHSFSALNFMLADAPRLIKKRKTLTRDEDLENFFGAEIE